MTYRGGSAFGAPQPGPGGPFGSSPSHAPGAAPGHTAPFSPPPAHAASAQAPGQSAGRTTAWILGALAAVVVAGAGGAGAVNALGGGGAAGSSTGPGGHEVVSPDPEQHDDGSRQSGSDSLIIGGGSADEAEGYAPSEGTEVEDNAERSEIYRNSTDFRFLEDQAGVLMPGVSFYAESGSQCSAGWFVTEEGTGATFMTTAGHCVEEGEEIYYANSAGDLVPAGVAVLSTGGALESDLDYGLVELYPDAAWDPRLPVPEDMQVAGEANAGWVEENRPYICRLGFRSGLSCGDFIERPSENVFRYENISDQGDSGGPVWALDPQTRQWYAVGVTSFIEHTDATNAGAVALSPLMVANDFKIIAG